MSEVNISNEYPYGNFPTHYTKDGQAKLKQQWQENTLKQPVHNSSKNDNDNHKHEHNKFDIHKLLPLIKKMNSNTTLSQGDLMNMLMSLMGKENNELADVFSIIANTQTVKEKDVKTESINSNKPSIDSFKKVQ